MSPLLVALAWLILPASLYLAGAVVSLRSRPTPATVGGVGSGINNGSSNNGDGNNSEPRVGEVSSSSSSSRSSSETGGGAVLGNASLAIARGGMVALAVTKLWRSGAESMSDGHGWEAHAAASGLLAGGAVFFGFTHVAVSKTLGWCQAPRSDDATSLIEMGRLDSGSASSFKSKTPRSALLSGTVGVCGHAIPAGATLYLLALESTSAAAGTLAVIMSLHTGFMGYALTLPFPLSSLKLQVLDTLAIVIGALSPAIGACLAAMLPASAVHAAKAPLLCFAGGLLLALGITHFNEMPGQVGRPGWAAWVELAAFIVAAGVLFTAK